MTESDRRLPGVAQHTSRGKSGREILDNVFSTVLSLVGPLSQDEIRLFLLLDFGILRRAIASVMTNGEAPSSIWKYRTMPRMQGKVNS